MHRKLQLLGAALTMALLLVCSLPTPVAQAHWGHSRFHRQQHAVVWGFCNGNDSLTRPCRYGREALVVASLETHTWWLMGDCVDARNGQYLGCFQMGAHERALYGNYRDPWHQARAAYLYFIATGRDWSPWSCKPWGSCV